MAKKDERICHYCKNKINLLTDEFIKVGTKKTFYAHKECANLHDKEAENLKELTDYIQSLYSPYEPDWGMIGKQIQRFKKDGLKYTGMKLSLQYHYEILGNKFNKKTGIGIIPYVYKNAATYYKNIENTRQQTIKVKTGQVNIIPIKQEEIEISTQHREKKLIDFNY